MAAPRLPKDLREALGADAAEDLLTIIDEIRVEIRGVEGRLEKRFDAIDARLDRMDDRFVARFATIEERIGDVKADLMKWSFVFWCGAVAAIAALAGVLER